MKEEIKQCCVVCGSPIRAIKLVPNEETFFMGMIQNDAYTASGLKLYAIEANCPNFKRSWSGHNGHGAYTFRDRTLEEVLNKFRTLEENL